MTQTKYVMFAKRWYQILLDDRLKISNTKFINDNIIQVTYKYKYSYQYTEESFSTNVFISTFTTLNAILRLYNMLEKLGKSVVCDTERIVYINNGENTIEPACMLG